MSRNRIWFALALVSIGLSYGVPALAAPKVAVGNAHNLLLKDDGTVWAWGANENGQLGDGTVQWRSARVQVKGLAGAVAVAAGSAHSLAIKSDGSVWAWGDNSFKQLGAEDGADRVAAAQIPGISNAAAVSGGGDFSAVLKSDGTVWTWGSNSHGQLGDGTTIDRASPVQVAGLSGVEAIDAGIWHCVALKSDGTVWAWGNNWFGQLGDGALVNRPTAFQIPGLDSVVAIAAGRTHSLALRSDGTVWTWGTLGDGSGTTYSPSNGTPPARMNGLVGVIAVGAGDSHAFAILYDGTVRSWGANRSGQLGDGTTTQQIAPVAVAGLADAIAVTGGALHSLAVRRDGTLWSWGDTFEGRLGNGEILLRPLATAVPAISGVKSAAAGNLHSAASKRDGTVWTWGYNDRGQLGDGTHLERGIPAQIAGLSGIVAVACGHTSSYALKSDGTVWAWGQNHSGQLGDGTITDRATPVQATGISGVTAIAAGSSYTLAIRSDGALWAWGKNDSGQLGDGTTINRARPVQVSGISDVIAAAGFEFHTLALRRDGTVWAWGNNYYGQLGDGTQISRTVPVQVGGLTGVVSIAAGPDYSVAVKSDGTVWAWGYNDYLRPGAPSAHPVPERMSQFNSAVQATAGGSHVLILNRDKTLWSWGKGVSGQLGYGLMSSSFEPVPVIGLHDVELASADYDHSLAITTDGTLWTWGGDEHGQLGMGSMSKRLTPVLVPDTFTISGKIFAANAWLPSAVVQLSGDGAAGYYTSSDGVYSFPDLPANRNYTITPLTPGYAFSPAQAVFNNLSANQTANFLALPAGTTHYATFSRSRLNFGAFSESRAATQAQEVLFSQSPNINASWTAASSHPWLQVSPLSGSGNARLTLSIQTLFLPGPGQYTASITLNSTGAAGGPVTIPVTLKVYAAPGSPFGSFDSPTNNATVSSNIPVTGWALDDIGIASLKIYRDAVSPEPAGAQIYIGDAVFIQDSRSDVETAYPGFPLHYRSGWGYMLLTNFLPNHGNGTFKLHAVATNAIGLSREIGTKTITVDNAHATKPFGTIDTPAQGATVSVTDLVNFGWALTPQPAKIPTDGSTIQVWLDGAPIGNVTYNNPRSDIDTLFPNYANTFGAVGFRYIDTTKLANGLHNIAWSVTDNQGRTDGVGSRFFSVFNAGSSASSIALPSPETPSSEARFRTGFDTTGPLQPLKDIEVPELGRVEIALPPGEWTGHLRVNEDLRELPAGSTLDPTNGVFVWQLGPGFRGPYELLFQSATQAIPVRIQVGPKPARMERQ